MTSEKQIAANRLNALKSTGPRTPEGKSKTCLNAKRDGFTGQMTSLSEDDYPIFDQFKSHFIADLQPKTFMETSLANSIAWDTWRLNHLRAMETNKFALGAVGPNIEITSESAELQFAIADTVTFTRQQDTFALMSIYEQRMNRSLQKNVALLRDLQAERRSLHTRDLEDEVLLAQASDMNGLTYQTPTTPTPNGSVFANNEILAAVNRAAALTMAAKTVKSAPASVQFADTSLISRSNIMNWPGSDAA